MCPQLAWCGISHVCEHTEHVLKTVTGTEAEEPIIVKGYNYLFIGKLKYFIAYIAMYYK